MIFQLSIKRFGAEAPLGESEHFKTRLVVSIYWKICRISFLLLQPIWMGEESLETYSLFRGLKKTDIKKQNKKQT